MISHSLFFSLALVCVSFAHECIHDRVQASITPTVDEQSFTWGVEADNEARKRAAMVDTQPLRVHFDTFNLGETANDCKSVGQQVVVNRETFTCRENDILTRETKDLLLKVFDKLKRELANMFRIVRADNFALNKYDWCYDDTIDISRYYDESSDPIRDATDFMLMVTSWPTGGSTIAWASYCRTNQFGRPIAGHLNFGNNHLNGDTFEAVYAVAMHEVFHAMGFHSARMGKMIDAEGTVFNGVSSLTLGDSSSGTKTVHVISAPNVKRVAREHYGCSTIEGQELEDYGTSGSAGSHWEQRNVDYEVMAPQAASSNSKYGPRVSMLTLAFFADLGYYYPNYTAASPYAYGKGQGCGFVQRPARERSGDYNCPTELTSNRCNALAVGYSSCGWYEYSEEVSLFQRPDLSSPNRGGNQYSDYVAAASGYITCDSITASAAVQRGQTSGDASRCMYSKVAQRGYISGTFQAACYQLRCPNDPEYGTSASASTGGGSASTDYGSISDCEACADAGGVFCTDGGWRTVGGNYVKQGYCAATSCASGVITVRSAAQCYRDCTYGSKSGECRDASQCSSFGGLSYSSSSGADGCQSEPGTVRCCVDVGTRKRSLESESVVGKSTTAGKSAEKRAVGGVEVNVGGAWHTCPTAGGETSVGTSSAAYAGTLDCPSLDDACCAHLDYCSAHGTCRAGHCACDAGYTGVSCEVAAATAQLQAPARDDWRVSNHANMDELPSLDDDSYTLVRKEEDLPDNFGNDLRAADDDEQESDSLATDADTLALVIGGVVAALVLAAVAFGAVVFFVVQRRKQIARS